MPTSTHLPVSSPDTRFALLRTVNSPADLRSMSRDTLKTLAHE